MRENECQGMVGRIFGHKFRPRHSEGVAKLESLKGCDAGEAADIIRATKPLTYHHDICERCGKTVNKPGGGDA